MSHSDLQVARTDGILERHEMLNNNGKYLVQLYMVVNSGGCKPVVAFMGAVQLV